MPPRVKEPVQNYRSYFWDTTLGLGIMSFLAFIVK